MADLSAETLIGIAVETVPGTYVAPTTGDYHPCVNLRPSFLEYSAENPEYQGTVHGNAAAILGKGIDISFDMVIRGPAGGAGPPAVGLFIPGRILRAAGFTENRLGTAIPPSPEADGGGSSTTRFLLGTTASATVDLYKGLVVWHQSLGAIGPSSLTMIRDYGIAVSKRAELCETLGLSPSGNYQIPVQLAYQLALTGTPPTLSASCWIGGRRYNASGLTVSSLRFNFPVASRQNQQYPTMSVTLSGSFESWSDTATPAIAGLGAIPTFNGGDFWAARTAMGGSSLTFDMGVRAGFPPNPNYASGHEPGQIVGSRRVATLNFNQRAKSYIDLVSLADAQAQHSIWAQYGTTSGNTVSFMLSNGRFGYQSPNPGQDFATLDGSFYLDAMDKSVSITFPYWS